MTPASWNASWNVSAPSTTACDCTRRSATSPPTTSTMDAATLSAARAAKGWPGPAVGASPTIAKTERNRRHEPLRLRQVSHPGLYHRLGSTSATQFRVRVTPRPGTCSSRG
jgi:hypothetical protein